MATSGWCAQRLLADLQAALVERLGLGVLALGLVQLRQVVQAGGHVGVVGPSACSRISRPAGERLRLGVPAQGLVQCRQVVQAGRHVGVVSAQRLLPDRQARWKSGSASAYCPWSWYSRQVVQARATSGWSGPSLLPDLQARW